MTPQSVQISNPKDESLPHVNKQVTLHVQNHMYFPILSLALYPLQTAKFKKVIGKNRGWEVGHLLEFSR